MSDITVYAIDMGGGKSSCDILRNLSPTLATTHYGEPAVVYEDIRREEIFQVGEGRDSGIAPKS